VLTFAVRCRYLAVVVAIRATRGLDGTGGGGGGQRARPAFGNAESVLVRRLFRWSVSFSLSPPPPLGKYVRFSANFSRTKTLVISTRFSGRVVFGVELVSVIAVCLSIMS